MDWQHRALRLASQVCGPASRWHEAVAAVPRHRFVPHWWTADPPGWRRTGGGADDERRLGAAYSDVSLVTAVAGRHADHAAPGETRLGGPTSSSTMPGLVVRMLRHARLYPGADNLEVGTGSGYGTALLCRRFGDAAVTSVDIDGYLTEAAGARLAEIGHHPTIAACDATARLPGAYDRIVSTVAVRPVPAPWLAGLRTGGRLATTLANTALIITAEKTEDGGAVGRVERDWAMFMSTRHGPCHPADRTDPTAHAASADGEETRGRHPVVNVIEAWELRSMLELEAPGVVLTHRGYPGRPQTLLMAHADGSWARADMRLWEPPTVVQGGPRRLWDILDRIRTTWLRLGHFPLYGARAEIDPDGTIRLDRGGWTWTVPPSEGDGT